jgi:hypothetical protein
VLQTTTTAWELGGGGGAVTAEWGVATVMRRAEDDNDRDHWQDMGMYWAWSHRDNGYDPTG